MMRIRGGPEEEAGRSERVHMMRGLLSFLNVSKILPN